MSDADGTEVAAARTKLRFWDTGPPGAPCLVVCHGGALDHASFRPVAVALASEWRVLLWDLPGHGLSQPMPHGFSVGLCAEALAAVMDAAGMQRAVILGFSFGGMVAQLFARAHPDRVAGLIAYACFAPLLAPAPLPAALIRVVTWGMFGPRSWAAIQRDFAARCSTVPEVQAEIVCAMRPLGKHGFLAMSRALLAAFRLDPAFRVSAPMLIVSGADDSNGAALRTSLAALRQTHPHAEEIVLPHAGHCAHQERPDAFMDAVRPFLRKL